MRVALPSTLSAKVEKLDKEIRDTKKRYVVEMAIVPVGQAERIMQGLSVFHPMEKDLSSIRKKFVAEVTSLFKDYIIRRTRDSKMGTTDQSISGLKARHDIEIELDMSEHEHNIFLKIVHDTFNDM